MSEAEERRAELERREALAKLFVIGHAEYVPEDMDLEPDLRRVRLTAEGLKERERIVRNMTEPPV